MRACHDTLGDHPSQGKDFGDTGDFNEELAAASTSRVYIPLEHFFAVASQFIPAFLQAASVLGVVPAKAGAATATIRLKAIIDTRVFTDVSSDADCTIIQAPKGGVGTATQCHARISRKQRHFVEVRSAVPKL